MTKEKEVDDRSTPERGSERGVGEQRTEGYKSQYWVTRTEFIRRRQGSKEDSTSGLKT